jgi:Sulfotransferase family
MSDAPHPFTFVVGCGRSGTTVLRTVLDAHPDLAVAHEGRFVAPLGLRRSRYERPEGFDTDQLVADLLADRAVRTNLELDEDDLRAALAPPVPDFATATRRVFAHYAARQGKSRYGDKFPGYVLRMDLLAGLFPEARFVHIVRDGRDVALSSAAIEGHEDDPVALAYNWRTRVRAGQEAGAQLGPARYHEVRYEALVARPAETVEPLCGFLDLAYVPAMLAFAERPGAVPAKVEGNPRHARLAEPLSPGTRS